MSAAQKCENFACLDFLIASLPDGNMLCLTEHSKAEAGFGLFIEDLELGGQTDAD